MSERIAAAVAEARKALAKLGEQLDAIDAALAERPTVGQLAKVLLDHYVEKWNAKYRGQKYVVNGPKDMAVCKRLIGPLTLDDLKRRVDRFLASTDPFYSNARHPLGLFASAVNKFGGSATVTSPEDDDDFLHAAPSNCRHSPACRSDADHTRRTIREVRRA